MKPINIYALTRVKNPELLGLMERQMSGRSRHLTIKEWEIEGLKTFSEKLGEVLPDAFKLTFFYSFTMPKLGKEFDLLRVNDDCVINIELKSGNVSDEAILKQLTLNRYYLSTLGKNMYSYLYLSNTDRLVRLSRSEKLVDTEWEDLARNLENQTDCYEGDIEDLFKEDRYLISPLTDPARFLRQDYFLTSQQRDIKKLIIKSINRNKGEVTYHGFTGLPGTGKTILLYDLAMQLSWEEYVCVFHFGSHEAELEELDMRLKRVDFYYCKPDEKIEVKREYTAILVDEGHRLTKDRLEDILGFSEEWKAPVIFSYDLEDSIAPEERKTYGAPLIEALPGYAGHRLTNKIRVNSELSSFISGVMCIRGRIHRREYPSVNVAYAENTDELRHLLTNFEDEGFMFIRDRKLSVEDEVFTGVSNMVETSAATCKEFDKVVMVMDENFTYDKEGYLRTTDKKEGEEDYRVRNLFHGLSRAKTSVALLIYNNEEVLDVILAILQKQKP